MKQAADLSSVSGGSVAPAYDASQKPPPGTPVRTADGALSDNYQTFFAGFRGTVTQDIEGALIGRQLSTFRWLNPSLAARSLLCSPNRCSPRLIVNTTLYNNGRRLVFTTLRGHALRLLLRPPAVPGRARHARGDPRPSRAARGEHNA